MFGQFYLDFLPNWLSRILILQEIERSYRRVVRKHENWYFTKPHLPSIVSNVHADEYREPLWFNPRPIEQECLFNCDTFWDRIIATLLISGEFSRTPILRSMHFIFAWYLGATHSLCIVSLPVITCQLQAPSRRLTAIRGNSSQYDVARISIDCCCFFVRAFAARSSYLNGRDSIIAFTQKSRRLIRRVLVYVLATCGKSLTVCGKHCVTFR